MTLLLDYAPLLAFFAAYAMRGIYFATVVLIAASFAAVLAGWLLTRRVNKVHLFTAVVAAVFGGLTLSLHDPQFIKLKPSVIYAVFALALLGSQFIGGKVLLARIPQQAIKLPEAVWRRVNLAWAAFFALCAGLNLYVAQNFSEVAWVKFKVFGFTALMFAFLLLHAPFLARYLEDGPPREKGDEG